MVPYTNKTNAMQETVTNTNERKTQFSLYLELMEAKESQALGERRMQEERQLRRTQRIYDYHERQRREAVELRRCMDYVSQHAHALETVLRGGGGGGAVPLGAALLRQVVSLQRCMTQCVGNAVRIRQMVSAHHKDQMDTMLTKMEGELRSWTSLLQNVADAARCSETVNDNLHNMIAEQRRCVGEVAASRVLQALFAESAGAAESPGAAGADADDSGAAGEDQSPAWGERRAAIRASSTPKTED